MSNTRRIRTPKVKPACQRCGKRLPRQPMDWNATLVEGVVVGVLCPQCQTPEENAEAEINAATLNYGARPDERIEGRRRWSGGPTRLVEVEGWGKVATLVDPGDGPSFIVPPLVFVDGVLRQGVNVLAAVRPPDFRSISLESLTSSERAGVSDGGC